MIEEILFVGGLIVGAVALTTLFYKLTPFYTHQPTRPSFVVFPKYKATFDNPVEEIQQSLINLKFTPTNSNELAYARGKIYGDFSAKLLKLHATIDPDNKTLWIRAPYMGVAFDTGDLWQVMQDVLQGTTDT